MLEIKKPLNEAKKIEMSKKGKEITQASPTEDSDMSLVFPYTTCNKDCRSSSWEEMHKFFEDEKPRVIIRVATTDASVPLDLTYFNVACSFIHKVTTRAKILPYKDMVKWVIYHLNIEDITFKDSKGVNISLFRAEDLRTMYHLPIL